ncbi:hypothetical protein CDD83_2343 [Cordyceps sp. RAO-2017]|nr:hypothetical protein CDD83_2343 [Cordyceps sp. RAO-2017]
MRLDDAVGGDPRRPLQAVDVLREEHLQQAAAGQQRDEGVRHRRPEPPGIQLPRQHVEGLWVPPEVVDVEHGLGVRQVQPRQIAVQARLGRSETSRGGEREGEEGQRGPEAGHKGGQRTARGRGDAGAGKHDDPPLLAPIVTDVVGDGGQRPRRQAARRDGVVDERRLVLAHCAARSGRSAIAAPPTYGCGDGRAAAATDSMAGQATSCCGGASKARPRLRWADERRMW